ncbi:hypothetical protein Nepgr_012847 [Nepenthes gracilis]|uniref:Uncharacterized protein n=1 Tax=Nepenthes gracilis TaxID=150966 RepID=A0AAD3SI91_NEPGR|nr:hypothetical protein Nepgr_012847 [Nepenthes gracilis]
MPLHNPFNHSVHATGLVTTTVPTPPWSRPAARRSARTLFAALKSPSIKNNFLHLFPGMNLSSQLKQLPLARHRPNPPEMICMLWGFLGVQVPENEEGNWSMVWGKLSLALPPKLTMKGVALLPLTDRSSYNRANPMAVEKVAGSKGSNLPSQATQDYGLPSLSRILR